jgi:hypothetical protein
VHLYDRPETYRKTHRGVNMTKFRVMAAKGRGQSVSLRATQGQELTEISTPSFDAPVATDPL